MKSHSAQCKIPCGLCLRKIELLKSGSLSRSRRETSQGAYTFQIFLEKEQMGQMPTVQQLLDTSCLSGDLKFEEVSVAHYQAKMTKRVDQLFPLYISVTPILPSPFVPQMPSCLIVQMPRFGNKYKMFSHIIPSTELDITDLLYNCEELV